MKSIIHTLKAAAFSTMLCTGTVFTMASCEKDRSVKEGVNDALDRRPAEGIKDAAEDAKDAVKDAAEDTKDAVKDATN